MQLGFRELEELFALRYGLELPSIAFRGRLQHLQRNNFPDAHIRPGKGSRALYGWGQIFQLSVALDLIDVGFTPEGATTLVRGSRQALLLGASLPVSGLSNAKLLRSVKEMKCAFAETVFVVTAVHALFAYGTREPRIEPTLAISSGKDLLERIKGDSPYDSSATYIDLGKRVMLTLNHIALNVKACSVEEIVADYSAWAEQHVLDT